MSLIPRIGEDRPRGSWLYGLRVYWSSGKEQTTGLVPWPALEGYLPLVD